MTEETFSEKIHATGDQLAATIKRLAAEGSIRRITVRAGDGRELLSLPLSAGAVVGGVAVLAAPTLVAITAIAAIFSSVTIEVERQGPEDPWGHEDEG